MMTLIFLKVIFAYSGKLRKYRKTQRRKYKVLLTPKQQSAFPSVSFPNSGGNKGVLMSGNEQGPGPWAPL